MIHHPIIQIYIPDTLLPLLRSPKTSSHHRLHVIGFIQRQKTVNRDNRVDNPAHSSGHLPEEEEVIQISLVALSTASSGHEEPSGYHDDEIVGQILTGDTALRRPPSWTFTDPTSIFLSLRHASPSASLTVERVVLDGVVLSPNPSSLLLFHYSPSTLNAAHYLRHLTPETSGLPPILRVAFRPLPRERGDIIPLQGQEWPADEVAKDPFGLGLGPLPEPEGDQPTSRRNSVSGVSSGVNAKKPSPFWSQLRSSITSRSMGLSQFLFRVQLLKNLLGGGLSTLASCNLVILLVFDVLLGCLVSYFLSSFPHLYSSLHAQVHHLLGMLLFVLNWLKGSPAGFKLNAALNSLLWRFFSYHLHLWGNYIGILEPILSLILSTIIWVGPLGVTVQLGLMKDLLSMATFHVYCLYIYATRLYRVLMLAIVSLGRLFYGRKWNPLRNRVDHVTLSISEMFLGALFFTIAIFLVPTVVIYYAVFLCLRLPVLALEWVLGYIVTLFNSIRLATTLLILANSPRVCDQVWLEVIEGQDDGQSEQGQSQSEVSSPYQFRIRLQSTKPIFSLPPHPFAVVDTLNALVRGHVLSR